MSQSSGKFGSVTVIIVIAIIAIAGFFFFKGNKKTTEEETIIRPLKTFVVGELTDLSVRKFPGRVRPHDEVDLAFQVSGQLIEFPVKRGQRVKKGQILGRLDPRDYQHALESHEAVLKKKKSDLEKVREMEKAEAATVQEITNAESGYGVARANVKISRKALEDTVLRAPFDGIIAKTYVDNYENITAKHPVLSLQNISNVEIAVQVPEEVMAKLKRDDKDKYKFIATFDYLPNRKFEVKVEEFATDSDPRTQTYLVKFIMPAPKDVSILPGMTATVAMYPKKGLTTQKTRFLVPVDAVGIDEKGNYYVWLVKEEKNGIGTVHKVNIKVGEMDKDKMFVISGLKAGDRIAAVGINFLKEGEKVRILDSNERVGSN